MVMATSSKELCGDAPLMHANPCDLELAPSKLHNKWHVVLIILNVSKNMFQEWQTTIGCYQRTACAWHGA
jgi:hypothetical protein